MRWCRHYHLRHRWHRRPRRRCNSFQLRCWRYHQKSMSPIKCQLRLVQHHHNTAGRYLKRSFKQFLTMYITIIAHIAGYLMKDAVGAAEETSYMWIVYTVTGVLSFMLLIILVVFLAIRQSKRGKLVIKQGKVYSKHFLTHPKKKKKRSTPTEMFNFWIESSIQLRLRR